jgi:hypothetical protein
MLRCFMIAKNARRHTQPNLQSRSLLGIAQDRIHPLKGLEVAVGSLHGCASPSGTARNNDIAVAFLTMTMWQLTSSPGFLSGCSCNASVW